MRKADPLSKIAEQAGPPVPGAFVREILVDLTAASMSLQLSQHAGYRAALLEQHPRAQRLVDFVRASDPLPVGSHNALRQLVATVIATGPGSAPR